MTGERSRVVGILAGRSPSERYSLHAGYIDSVAQAGGFPRVLPTGPGINFDDLCAEVLACDALLVSGGVDIDPELSHLVVKTEAIDPDRARDELEIAAVHAARSAGMRILGICRGIQLIAVAHGGSLHGDLESLGFLGHNLESRQYEPVHEVKAEPGSLAEELLGEITTVNSAHHQAVAGPVEGFEVTARTADGVIEAIEAPGVLGIQWHPERLASGDSRHLEPFRWLLR